MHLVSQESSSGRRERDVVQVAFYFNPHMSIVWSQVSHGFALGDDCDSSKLDPDSPLVSEGSRFFCLFAGIGDIKPSMLTFARSWRPNTYIVMLR